MTWDMDAFAERARYRPASIALLLASNLVVAGVFLGIPEWICFPIFLFLSIVLTVMTYRRLRDGGFSGAWVLLQIFPIGIGPTWHLSDHLTAHPAGFIISCVPMILAWLAPANSGAPAGAEAAQARAMPISVRPREDGHLRARR